MQYSPDQTCVRTLCGHTTDYDQELGTRLCLPLVEHQQGLSFQPQELGWTLQKLELMLPDIIACNEISQAFLLHILIIKYWKQEMRRVIEQCC